MTRYLSSRLLSGLLTLFLFVTLLFFLVNLVVPFDWVDQFILTADVAESMRDRLGLSAPLWQRYLVWVQGVFTFDLGQSFTGESVWGTIADAMPTTLLLLGVGLGIAFLVGGWMGRMAGHTKRPLLSGAISFVAIVFLTAFPPTLAVTLENGAQSILGYRESGEFGSIDSRLWSEQTLTPSQVMWRMLAVVFGALLLLWALELMVARLLRKDLPRWLFPIGMVVVPLAMWRLMGLESLALDLGATMTLLLAGVALLTFGDVALVTRAAMDDVMLQDFIMVARAKGLPERRVRDRHAARAALLPVLSRMTVAVPYFLTGLVILEAVFSGVGVAGTVNPLQRFGGPVGLGTVIFSALRLQDTPLVVGSLLVVGLITLLTRLALDVAHATLDPRIRVHQRRRG
jgi:peptide/nickel transport system permease protein